MREVAQGFHNFLMLDAGAKPSSVNASITAVYHFYSFLGYKVPPVLRDWVVKDVPRVLTRDELDRLILAIAAQPSRRDKALLSVLLFTGIRIGECKDLRLGDLEISAHTGKLKVTTRNRSRVIPLNHLARQSMLHWLIERTEKFSVDDDQAVFPNKSGDFMTRAAVDEIVRKVARTANLNICAQVLRNTFLSSLLQNGNTLQSVAEVAGQAKIEHIRRYRKSSGQLESLGMFNDGMFLESIAEISLAT
jgi:site-specific recombinase XerD